MKYFLSLLLLVLSLTTNSWFPVIMKFVQVNTNVIQGFDSLLQILLVVAAGLNIMFGTKNKKDGEKRIYNIKKIKTETGDVVTGDKIINGEDLTKKKS